MASYVVFKAGLKLLEFVQLLWLIGRLARYTVIHLARWVKFNPRFNPGLALIGVCGTELNRGLNFNNRFGDLTLG